MAQTRLHHDVEYRPVSEIPVPQVVAPESLLYEGDDDPEFPMVEERLGEPGDIPQRNTVGVSKRAEPALRPDHGGHEFVTVHLEGCRPTRHGAMEIL